MTNQKNRTKFERVLNRLFRKIIDLEIDDLNFCLKIVEKELRKSALIIENTPDNIYKTFFQIEDEKSLILAEKLYQTYKKKIKLP